MTELAACPACESAEIEPLYRLDSIPVQSCVLLETREEAEAFPRAPLELCACHTCGFVFNTLFNPALINYAATTEESQHFSGTFNCFADKLVREVADRYDLRGRRTLEIGCGKGDFLLALVRETGTIGIGVDPGVDLTRHAALGQGNPSFRREYFDSAGLDERPDFIVCRHTLEHIQDVGTFIKGIATLTKFTPDVGVFFETPDVERVLLEGAFWDIYYEHCSYFTRGSHARLFRGAGFAIDDIRLDYDDQYIIQYAHPGEGDLAPAECDLAELRKLVRQFPARVAQTRVHWTDYVRSRHAAGKRVALWGGGSKAVSFLTSNALTNEVEQVIDINPFKQGKYLPGCRHQVMGPDTLVSEPPDCVIAMNHVYLEEIGQQLADLGINAELTAL